MPTPLHDLKRRGFWIFARTCFALYRRFPLFGTLRASIGIIQKEDKFLMIHRNDGRGLSLPGGISKWRETEEETLRREILEETGLSVGENELKRKYYSDADVPCAISVYEVRAAGELKNSWEGSAKWATLAELEPRLMLSQRPVLDLIKELAASSRAVSEKS
ncbi:MAG: NUDIX domain-containing protein [Candidatus Sulfotelmatobacter sp.]